MVDLNTPLLVYFLAPLPESERCPSFQVSATEEKSFDVRTDYGSWPTSSKLIIILQCFSSLLLEPLQKPEAGDVDDVQLFRDGWDGTLDIVKIL